MKKTPTLAISLKFSKLSRYDCWGLWNKVMRLLVLFQINENEGEDENAEVVKVSDEPTRKAFPKEPSRLDEDDDELEKVRFETLSKFVEISMWLTL